ncbi:type II toxin-antitoxin system Phd/YefM family antitoxin [Amycolatopsis sp. cmx-11-12]|uniref:type II toxin-antitoxin system Phd/YefM family antitoxin n=1 Tax=Amycolatopsis sp. cmx-11-12 TaxID=2785795 RepID=UPI003917038D
MVRHITQRELRDGTPDLMRAIEEGDSFVLMRNGMPVADIVSRSQKPTFANVDRAADPDPHRGPGEPDQ